MKRVNKPVTTKERAAFVDAWVEGDSALTIARRHGRAISTVYEHLEAMGYKPPKRFVVTSRAVRQWVEWWEQGKSIKWIARRAGCQRHCVSRHLVSRGIDTRSRAYKKGQKVRPANVLVCRVDDPIAIAEAVLAREGKRCLIRKGRDRRLQGIANRFGVSLSTVCRIAAHVREHGMVGIERAA